MAERDLYYVALKVFLEHDGNLFIFKDKYGDWDIPGGRIKTDEFTAPFEKVIERKMREELGSSVKYKLGTPIVLMRHERQENGKNVRIFAVGYTATLVSGDIQLSEQHTESKWVQIRAFKPEQFFTGGWLEGVKEYLKIKNESQQ